MSAKGQRATCLLALGMCVASAASAGDTRVLIWDERQPEQAQAYENFLGGAIGEHLSKQGGFRVSHGSLEMPEQGLGDGVLDDADVLIWWGHRRHAEVSRDRVEGVVRRVLEGRLGVVFLHSSIDARPFARLMEERAKQWALAVLPEEGRAGVEFEFKESPGRGVAFDAGLEVDGKRVRLTRPSGKIAAWRADGEPGHMWTRVREHPIARGLPGMWVIPRTEMYREPFHVPEPDEVVFEETWERGERFRSGCVWEVGKGRVFYFRPGHETYPVYRQEENLRVVENAVVWIIDNR